MNGFLGDSESVSRSRLIAIYLVLLVIVVVGVSLSIAAGEKQDAQPAIAGGYDVSGASPCTGRSFDLTQSGQFVGIEADTGGLSGKLRLHGESLTGSVNCIDGRQAELDARVAGRRLTGDIGGQPVAAELVRDPPSPGSPKHSTPSSIDGDYELAPSSVCLGGGLKLAGPQDKLRLTADDRPLGAVGYDNGALTGTLRCLHGGQVKLEGQATGRKLDLALTPVGDAISPAADAPAAEHVEADKTRDPGSTIAAFFVAVAVIMLTARLFGAVAIRVAQPRVMGEVIAGIALRPERVRRALPRSPGARSSRRTSFPSSASSANLGLIFYMFLVGLELDLTQLRGRVARPRRSRTRAWLFPLVLGLLGRGAGLCLLAPPTTNSWPSPCSWQWRCRSPLSRSWPASWSSAGCSRARSAH